MITVLVKALARLLNELRHFCLRIFLTILLHVRLDHLFTMGLCRLLHVKLLLYDRKLLENSLHLLQQSHCNLVICVLILIYDTISLKFFKKFWMLLLYLHQISEFFLRAIEVFVLLSLWIKVACLGIVLPELALSHRLAISRSKTISNLWHRALSHLLKLFEFA